MDPAPPQRSLLDRYAAARGWLEPAFWVLCFLVNGLANAVTVGLDLQRRGVAHAAWEPWVLELSSAAVLLALLPAVVAFDRRFPLWRDTWRRHWPWHVAASVVFSLLHVACMVALREAVFALLGADYRPGAWSTTLGYEYLKDVRTYALILSALYLYRLLLLRLQGEVRVLDAPDAPLGAGPAATNAGDGGVPAAGGADPIARPLRFLVRKLRREFLILARDIEWVQASGNYVNLHVLGHDYLLRGTIGGFEQKLDPALFLRVHRSYIVNLERVDAIEPLDTGDAKLHLKGGGAIPCSRNYRDALRARVEVPRGA
jgi:DNA-binding LytR/AlgR family response regulator